MTLGELLEQLKDCPADKQLYAADSELTATYPIRGYEVEYGDNGKVVGVRFLIREEDAIPIDKEINHNDN